MGDLDGRIQRAADAIAETLEATAGELAKATPRQLSTAPSQETVATVALLHRLAEWLPDLCPRAMLGEVKRQEWALLANTLRSAAEAAGREVGSPVVIDPQVVEAED